MLPSIDASLTVSHTQQGSFANTGSSFIVGPNASPWQPEAVAAAASAVPVAGSAAQMPFFHDPINLVWGLGIGGIVLLLVAIAKHIFKG